MDIEKIKQLRESTGAGVMAAKKALQEANGNLDAAANAIREAGLAKAEKRSDRDTACGIVYSYIHGEGEMGAMLELNCETSFVAKTDEFKSLAHEIALQIVSMNPENTDDLLAQDSIKNSKSTIEELIKDVIAKTGENITVKQFVRYALSGE